MRKVSSHYCLLPNGIWAKRPIIELDQSGSIINIRILNDGFKEEPGLEYFPGVLIPSFVMFVDGISTSSNKLFINRCIASGVRRFVTNCRIVLPHSIQSHVTKDNHTVGEVTAWDQIKLDCAHGVELSEAILRQTKYASQSLGVSNRWGELEVGRNPGLLLLQGVDIISFKLSDKVTLKVIQD